MYHLGTKLPESTGSEAAYESDLNYAWLADSVASEGSVVTTWPAV